MSRMGTVFFAAAIVVFASPASFAMPPADGSHTNSSVEAIRLVCDEFGRCWNSPDYGYLPRLEQPNKWERKGFCPPGQAKNGNC